MGLGCEQEEVVWVVKFGSSTGLLSPSHSPGFPPILCILNVTLGQSRFGGGSKQLQHNNSQGGYVWCTRSSFAEKRVIRNGLADGVL